MGLKLAIGNKNYSSWSMRPWVALKAAGIAFEEKFIPLYTGAADKQRILDVTRSGKVPALIDGDVTVWDSLAIIEYAAERFPDAHLWPADAASRAHARSVSAEMHSGFVALRTQLPMNLARQAGPAQWDAAAERDIARIQTLWASLRSQHGHAGEFLCGEFGIVDAMYAPVALRFASYGVPLFEAAGDYLAALDALPALRQWRLDAERERAGRG